MSNKKMKKPTKNTNVIFHKIERLQFLKGEQRLAVLLFCLVCIAIFLPDWK